MKCQILFSGKNKKNNIILSSAENAQRVVKVKMPRKPASENVVCLCRLLNILANFSTFFCIQANSVDPDQTAPKGAV